MSNVIITIYIIYIFLRKVNGEEVTILSPVSPIPDSVPILTEAPIPAAVPADAKISTEITTLSTALADENIISSNDSDEPPFIIGTVTAPETTALVETKTTIALSRTTSSAQTASSKTETITNSRIESEDTPRPEKAPFRIEAITTSETTALTESQTTTVFSPAQTTSPRIEIIANKYRGETNNASRRDGSIFRVEVVTTSETTALIEIKKTATLVPAIPSTQDTTARIQIITNYRKEPGNISQSLRGDNQAPSLTPITTDAHSTNFNRPTIAATSPTATTTRLGKKITEKFGDYNYDEWEFGDREWVAEKLVEWIFLFLRRLVKRFPERTRLISIGKSRGGFPIYAVEIAHWMHSGATIVIDAGYDATDRLGINLALWTLNELASRAYRNLVTLMGIKIIVVPLINPDNYNLSIWKQNMEPCRENLFNAFDIGQPPQNPCPGFFQNEEILAVSKYYQKIPKFKLYFSIHSGAAEVGYPFGYRPDFHYNSSEMAKNMRSVIKDKLKGDVTVNSLRGLINNVTGTPIDWLIEKVGVRYSIYLCARRSITVPDQMNTIKVNYEAIRYGILQLQLTDAEIAWAIYTDFERNLSNTPRLSINVDLVILIVIINVWFQ